MSASFSIKYFVTSELPCQAAVCNSRFSAQSIGSLISDTLETSLFRVSKSLYLHAFINSRARILNILKFEVKLSVRS